MRRSQKDDVWLISKTGTAQAKVAMTMGYCRFLATQTAEEAKKKYQQIRCDALHFNVNLQQWCTCMSLKFIK